MNLNPSAPPQNRLTQKILMVHPLEDSFLRLFAPAGLENDFSLNSHQNDFIAKINQSKKKETTFLNNYLEVC